MSNISIDEFNNLPEKEKGKRYKDLNEHEKFLVRMSMNLGYEVVGTSKISEKDKEWTEELIQEIEAQEKNKT